MGLMLIDVSLTEGRAWHEASDEAWAGYAAAVYAAAVERRAGRGPVERESLAAGALVALGLSGFTAAVRTGTVGH